MYGFDEFELYVDDYNIEDTREDLDRIVKYFQSMDYYDLACDLHFPKWRDLPIEVAKLSDCFFVDEETEPASLPEWMQAAPLGFVKGKSIPMWGRMCFPVKDVLGHTMGFVGWDPTVEKEDKAPKYLDSKNYGYKAKSTTLYGMEMLPEYYRSKEPVFVTEGLMCTLYLRLNGFQALSSLGSYLTPYVIQILKRFGSRLVMVPDNDETGDKYVRQCKRALPKSLIVQCAYGKDIEGCRKENNHAYEQDLLKDLKSLSNPFARTKILIRR